MLAIPKFPFLFDFIEAKVKESEFSLKIEELFPFLFDFIEAKVSFFFQQLIAMLERFHFYSTS